MKRLFLLLLLASLFLPLAINLHQPVQAAPAQQSDDDWPIPGGHFYGQTTPVGYGFAVIDDDQAAFWSGFNDLGGLQNVGYPISRRFYHGGFLTQAFQKLVLQWRPEVSESWPINVFDDLSYAGYDERLYTARQTPYHLGEVEPPGTPWPEVVHNRQSFLDVNPALRERYFSLADPLTAFGLPTSRVEDMGNHYAVRTQRAVFQQWKEEVDWANAGQVTVANGGDIAKELGLFPATALEPEPAIADGTYTCDVVHGRSWITPDGWYSELDSSPSGEGGSTVYSYDPTTIGGGGGIPPDKIKIDLAPLFNPEGMSIEEVLEEERALYEDLPLPNTVGPSVIVMIAGLSGYQFDVLPPESFYNIRVILLENDDGRIMKIGMIPVNSDYMGLALAMLETLEIEECEPQPVER